MNKLLLLLGVIFVTACCRAQDIPVDDLLGFSSLSTKKFDSYISKKGFRSAGRSFINDTIVDAWQQVSPDPDSTKPTIFRRVYRYQNGKNFSFGLQTSCRQEYLSALSRLKEEGFFCGNAGDTGGTSFLFQKTSYTIETSSLIEDSLVYYAMVFRDQVMPSSREVVYGNDLVKFTSHEYLATFFGRNNVRKDLYYFSESESNQCTVLFPNTSRQAVFIWEDEQNLRGLLQVIISGNLPTAGSAGFTQQMRENAWLLDNGLRFDMRLDELIRLNGEDLLFYGKNTTSPLMLLPKNKGDIDLSSTGIILGCINCGGSSLLDKKVVSAYDAIDQSLRLHIAMLILFPSDQESGVNSSHSTAGKR